MFKAMRKNEGFTLIELMVVVLIIGVLVAIAVPVFMNASKQSKIKSDLANCKTIEGAVEQFKATNAKATTVTQTDLEPDYVKTWPVCPIDSAAYSVSIAGVDHTCAEVEWTAAGGQVKPTP